ncbi:hypothetical protein KC878_01895 [Candidatus Saccharibacteria bacterium]|nr:hypothetical protein [Candidatus Saccharibacteria bacterium]MCB9821119.1 hypothetical protein [Candidatus Nomurabacteria bacterium]
MGVDDKWSDERSALDQEGGWYNRQAGTKLAERPAGESAGSKLDEGQAYTGSLGADAGSKEAATEKQKLAKAGGAKSAQVGDDSDSGDKKDRKKAALAIIGVIGLPVIAVFLVLYLFLGFSIEHLAQLQHTYRFAQTQRAIGKVTRQITIAQFSLTDDSLIPRNLPGGRTGLISRLAGWTPEKALLTMGAADIKLTYGRGSIPGSRKLTGFSYIDEAGVEIKRTTRGPGAITEGVLLDELTSQIDKGLVNMNKGWLFRRRTMRYVRESSGIVLARFKEFLAAQKAGRRLSLTEMRAAGLTEDVSHVRAGRAPPEPSISEARAAANEFEEGIKEGRVSRFKRVLGSNAIERLNRVGQISDYLFYLTLYCMGRDVFKNIRTAIDGRIDGFMNHASSLFTANDQFHAGGENATQDALHYETQKWEGAELSQEYAMATGRPISTVPLDNRATNADSPMKLLGLDLETLDVVATVGELASGKSIPGVGSLLDYVCGWIMNPVFQFSTIALELLALVMSAGGSKGATKLTTESIKFAAKRMVRDFALGTFADFALRWSVELATTSYAVFGPGEGAKAYNAAGAGDVLTGSIGIPMKYTNKISPQEASMQQRESVLAYQQAERSKGWLYAYFSPRSPFSITSSILINTPASFSTLSIGIGRFFSWLTKPSSSFNFAFAGVGAAATYSPETEFYDMQDYLYGFSEGSFYDFQDLTNSLEKNDGEKLGSLIDDYGECLTYTVKDVALGDVDDSCNDEGALQLKRYYLFCETIDAVTRVGSNNDGYNTNDCLDLDGKTPVTNSLSGNSTNSQSGATTTEGLVHYPRYNMYFPGCIWDGTQPPEADSHNGGYAQQPGAKAIQKLVNDKYGQGGTGVIGRCRDAGPDMHSTGRAVDSYFKAYVPAELAKGNSALGWLVTNADIFGIDYAKFWKVEWYRSKGWQCVASAKSAQEHITHIHFQLSWDGAVEKTAYFTDGAVPKENNQGRFIDQNACKPSQP